jgi:hypothetical protein
MSKHRKQKGPPPVSDADYFEGEVGPPTYHVPVPPAKSRGRLLPGGGVELLPLTSEELRESRPLVPASEEVAKLPRVAREAFAARCASRVARLREGATSPEAAAALILAAATTETPIRRLLLCIRRDFDRLMYLAKKHNWTDDTPVPPDVFGPLWPKNLIPDWAKEPLSQPPTSTTQ